MIEEETGKTTKKMEYAWLMIARVWKKEVDYGKLAPKREWVRKPGGCLNRDGMGLQMWKRLKVAGYADFPSALRRLWERFRPPRKGSPTKDRWGEHALVAEIVQGKRDACPGEERTRSLQR